MEDLDAESGHQDRLEADAGVRDGGELFPREHGRLLVGQVAKSSGRLEERDKLVRQHLAVAHRRRGPPVGLEDARQRGGGEALDAPVDGAGRLVRACVRGLGWGRGWGRGWGPWSKPYPHSSESKQFRSTPDFLGSPDGLWSGGQAWAPAGGCCRIGVASLQMRHLRSGGYVVLPRSHLWFLFSSERRPCGGGPGGGGVGGGVEGGDLGVRGCGACRRRCRRGGLQASGGARFQWRPGR